MEKKWTRKDSLYEDFDICGQQTEQKNKNNNAVSVLEIMYTIHAIFIKAESIPALSYWWHEQVFELVAMGLRDHKLDSVLLRLA